MTVSKLAAATALGFTMMNGPANAAVVIQTSSRTAATS